METKICKKCGELPIEKFYLTKGGRYRCHQCIIFYAEEYRKKNKDKIKNYSQLDYVKKQRYAKRISYSQRNQLYVYELLKHKSCVDCNDNRIEVLDFDHVKGNKENSICDIIRQALSIETLQKEIDKCEVRCANCHRIKTSKERGWFRSLMG